MDFDYSETRIIIKCDNIVDQNCPKITGLCTILSRTFSKGFR